MTLFVVRASTMGALKDASDVWFEENTEWPTREGTTRRTRSLCFRVRFLKHWRGGRQPSTGRSLPINRAGRDSIPIPAEPDHWRTRAAHVIERDKQLKVRQLLAVPRLAPSANRSPMITYIWPAQVIQRSFIWYDGVDGGAHTVRAIMALSFASPSRH